MCFGQTEAVCMSESVSGMRVSFYVCLLPALMAECVPSLT